MKFLVLVSVIFTSITALFSSAEEPRVAVFVEEDFPILGGTPALPPFKVAETLRRNGIAVAELSAAELSDPAKLNVSRFTTLILWNGNAFPQPAISNLRAFHAAGGSFVLNGIPFTHACELRAGKWHDLGHRNAFRHGANGMGTGGFGGPAKGVARFRIPPNPLGLRADMLSIGEAKVQWFEPADFPGEDRVTPLLEVETENGKVHAASVIVQHECADFRGARDVWIGQTAGGNEEGDRFLATQLLVRGVIWELHDKQALDDADLIERLANLDKIEKPKPLPTNLQYVETPRPWGNTFLPKSRPPAKKLLAVDFAALKPDERIAITCLQGLTSREQPRIWLLRNSEDRAWLEWHKTKGHIDSYEIVGDWTSLFRENSNVVVGAVIADTQLYRGDLLAVNVAACEDCIVTTPELASRLALPVKIDLRNKFTSYAEGQRWLWANYKDRLNRHLADYCVPTRITQGTFAYQYQWRAPLIWPCGPKDERKPGADRFAEKRAVAEMFSEMSPNSPILGFPFGGEGIGLGEPPGVELASRYARPLVCSDYLANICVTSGVRIHRFAQPAPPPTPALDRSKIYVALAMSDGDNMNVWLDFFRRYFDHPSHGKFPLAFGMGPAMRELMPAVTEWYFERATPVNEFICDVSGAGYIQPPNYGLAFTDRERTWSGFLDWTAQMLPPLDMHTVRPVEGDDAQLARYAKALPFCHSIFADMGCYTGHRGIQNLTYTLPGGTPVFRAATTWRKDGKGLLGEVREHVGAQRPAFVNAFVHCWTFNPDDIARIVAEADKDIVFVTPRQLAALYRSVREDAPAR